MKKVLIVISSILLSVLVLLVAAVFALRYYRTSGYLSKDELLTIFIENEEAFEYTTSALLRYKEAFEFDVNRKTGTIEFLRVSPDIKASILSDDVLMEYLFQIAAPFKSMRIVVYSTDYGTIRQVDKRYVFFGGNRPIQYFDPPIPEDDPKLVHGDDIFGKIKDNWYFYVHMNI